MQRFLSRIEDALVRNPGAFADQLYHQWVTQHPGFKPGAKGCLVSKTV